MKNKNPATMRTAFIRVSHENILTEKTECVLSTEEKALLVGFNDEPEPEPEQVKPETGEPVIVYYTFDDILTTLKTWAETKHITYYAVAHDRDVNEKGEPVKLHYHIVIQFRDSTSFNQVKKQFPYGNIQSAGKVRYCVRYLIHADQPLKTEYQWDDIKTNGDLAPYKLASNQMNDINLEKIYEMIAKDEITLNNYPQKIPMSIYAKYKNRIINALELRVRQVTMDPMRTIKVFFLTGPSSMGKTHYAYKLAEKLYPDEKPCYSSALNDPWQNYTGQKVMILDDFRDNGAITYNDILKMLDPNYRTSIHSRFTNKTFLGDVIIITSIVPLDAWYVNKNPEPRLQFLRRLTYVYTFGPRKIDLKEWDERTSEHKPVGQIDNVYSAAYCGTEKVNGQHDSLRSLLTKIGFDVHESYNSNTLKLETETTEENKHA